MNIIPDRMHSNTSQEHDCISKFHNIPEMFQKGVYLPDLARNIIMPNESSFRLFQHGTLVPRSLRRHFHSSPCYLCHDMDSSFFTRLGDIKRASREFACNNCTFLANSLSALLRSAKDRVVGEKGLLGEKNMYVLVWVLEKKLGEVRLWNVKSFENGDTISNSSIGAIRLEYRRTINTNSTFSFILSTPVTPSSAKEQAVVEKVRSWIENCVQTHELCIVDTENTPPARLLHIDGGTLRLVDSPQGTNYSTLSYCWGNDPSIKTTIDNLARHKKSIGLEELPRTIRDYVLLCQKLNIQYAWIDALCIVQDDTKDWERECEKMGSIYANSHLTVSASAGSDSSVGLWDFSSKRAECSPFQKEILIDSQNGKPYEEAGAKRWPRKTEDYLLMREIHDHSLFTLLTSSNGSDKVPLFERAWAMQERFLSRRTVHFGPSEVIWECKTCKRCQCGRLDEFGPEADLLKRQRMEEYASINILQGHLPADPDETLRTWLRFVELFSAKSLTFDTDRLPAISGLAEEFENQGLGIYLAGLWSKHLLEGLAWMSIDPNAWRPHQYRAPSWAWSSIEGAIQYAHTTRPRQDGEPSEIHVSKKPMFSPCAKVRAFTSGGSGLNTFGNLEYARVEISAPTAEAIILVNRNQEGQHWTRGFSYVVQQGELMLGFRPDVPSEALSVIEDDKGRCLTLLLGEGGLPEDRYLMALVLVESGERGPAYRRVGTIIGTKSHYAPYQGLQRCMDNEEWLGLEEDLQSTLRVWFPERHARLTIV